MKLCRETKDLLSYFARVAKRSDRRADVGIGQAKLNHATGLPESANDLAPRASAISGPRLALAVVLPMRGFAAAALSRTCRTQEGEEELVLLSRISPDDWTETETEQVEHLETAYAIAAARATEEHGWFDLDPISHMFADYAGEHGQTCLKATGLPYKIAIRWPGLKFAMEWIAKPENKAYAADPGLAFGMSAEARRAAPEWAKQEELV